MAIQMSSDRSTTAENQPTGSFYDQLFPPNRNRLKEFGAAKRFTVTEPPYIASAAIGFEPGYVSSSIWLCPAVSEYTIANYLVPYFYEWGIDTPNKVTLFNLFVVRVACLICFAWSGGDDNGLIGYWILVVLLCLQMMVDALDGQMARHYGLGSEFGGWLDAMTDNIFGACFTLISLYRTATSNDSWIPTIIASLIFTELCICGNCFILAKQQKLHWNHQNILQKLGNYQMIYASYIYAVLVFVYVSMGWWK